MRIKRNRRMAARRPSLRHRRASRKYRANEAKKFIDFARLCGIFVRAHRGKYVYVRGRPTIRRSPSATRRPRSSGGDAEIEMEIRAPR